jgi:hypothetical protein
VRLPEALDLLIVFVDGNAIVICKQADQEKSLRISKSSYCGAE